MIILEHLQNYPSLEIDRKHKIPGKSLVGGHFVSQALFKSKKNQEVIFPKGGVSQSLDYVYSPYPMPHSTNTIRELPFEAAEDQFSNNNLLSMFVL